MLWLQACSYLVTTFLPSNVDQSKEILARKGSTFQLPSKYFIVQKVTNTICSDEITF